ncbi:competence protein CoiA [Pedobacter psychrotolerans]|uniref:competence protein CoiA n=1 Tax=Pedobacter psychrotolerans TaxID=1843235 RepID=UPI003F9821FC
MQYALLNGCKAEAVRGAQGICMCCGQKVIAKCGSINIKHWAHAVADRCDSWWENETIWHREWKAEFPVNFREVNFFDEKLLEFHRADIHTAAGITIELQNSAISLTELQAREAFYPKLIWLVNGLKFKGFKILKSIPDPHHPALDDFEFCLSEHLSMIRKIDALTQNPNPAILNFYHQDLKSVPVSTAFYAFSWRHPHQAWMQVSCPVFIDFGGHFLYRLRKRYQISGHYSYLQLVSKKSFLAKYAIG